MRLVLNANILFAAIIKNATTRKLLTDLRLELHAPGIILFEQEKYKRLIAEKSRLSAAETEKLVTTLLTLVHIQEPSTESLIHAKQFSPDPDDIAYLALCLDLRCPLWSNDRRLKEQSVVRVLTTEELLSLNR